MARAAGFFILALLASAFARAAAFELSPIVVQLEPRGPGSARNMVVNNTQPEPIALMIEVYARSANEQGEEVRVPDYDSFVIIPPQLVVEAGTSQAIRVQWIGPPDLERETAFRLIVRQLPIRFFNESQGSDLQADVAVAYRYEAAVYVAPSQSKPLAELVSSEAALDDAGRPVLRLTIASRGSRRAILDQPRVQITSAYGGSVELTGERVRPLQMKNILSGTQAVIDIPWPDEVEFGPVSVTLSTRYFVG
jgi:fimbrial chaperone protein